MEDSEEEQQELGNKMLGTQSLNGSLNDNPAPIASIASFAQTLTQALKSTDTKLLESCFLQQSKNNKNLISNTIQRLPRKLLHTLIEQIVICLNRKKRGYGDGVTVATVRRTKTLIEWVRQILLIHMSYLLTIPTLVTQLTTLHASLQKRLNLHTKLLSLNGRLELVLNQIELSKLSNGDSQSTGIKTIKAIDKAKKKAVSAPKQEPYRYVEGESSASEEEGDNSEDDSDDSSDQSEDEADGDSDEAGQTDSDEEGSVEDVVLGSGSDEEDSGDNESEAEDGTSRIKKLTNGINDLLDLEAEESESEGGGGDDDDDDDEEEEEEEEDDDDDSMEGFIDDGSEGGSEEEGSD